MVAILAYQCIGVIFEPGCAPATAQPALTGWLNTGVTAELQSHRWTLTPYI